MLLAELDSAALASRLARPGLDLRIGPFALRVTTRDPGLARSLRLLYGHSELLPEHGFLDYRVQVAPPVGLRRWVRPQLVFSVDGIAPFWPSPPAHGPATFEWGLNWCIATQAHRYLMLHAAAIERGGRVAIMPGEPGAGKSTLTAALAHRGWRLLTDEITLLSRSGVEITPLTRPVSLKNRSIEVLRRFAPEAVIGTPIDGTNKGTVALVAAPEDSARRAAEPARPGWVIFPRYRAGAPAVLEPERPGVALMELARAGFNYSIHGRAGFEALANLVEQSACYRFSYGQLDDAVATFAALVPP